MSILHVEFQFDIGNVVTHKAMASTCRPEDFMPLFIMGRTAFEWATGVERVYKCRQIYRPRSGFSLSAGGATFNASLNDHGTIDVAEVELMLFPDDATAAAIAAAKAALT